MFDDGGLGLRGADVLGTTHLLTSARAPVVADGLAPRSQQRLAAQTALTVSAEDKALEHIGPTLAIRSSGSPAPFCDALGKVGLGWRDDGVVGTWADILAAAVDGLAEVERRPAQDVSDALLAPCLAAPGDATGVEIGCQRTVGGVLFAAVLIEDETDDLSLLLDDRQVMGLDDSVLLVADGAVTERV